MPAGVPSCTTLIRSASESATTLGMVAIDGALSAPLPSTQRQPAQFLANCYAPTLVPFVCSWAAIGGPRKGTALERPTSRYTGELSSDSKFSSKERFIVPFKTSFIPVSRYKKC
jgi:hypothetical protein